MAATAAFGTRLIPATLRFVAALVSPIAVCLVVGAPVSPSIVSSIVVVVSHSRYGMDVNALTLIVCPRRRQDLDRTGG
ncbi:hypothetical protein CYV19_15025 [Natronobacterium gregoryi SP2]|uniref:Uncharacterized protein n=1 Tax=Natronobacterium gregoryi (strain ATCC 43098 / DSM 3393 / CCM 3738 / CIP 104747 / IAM 13177 / JCM 8860 / NBRC 102187 / NCIMB 2189 / SP2) TaxID=797304 RepID=L9YKX5_NATGS|nr:hypothetical protein C490_01070 [Natronobacterium gregoryi SP2]PLK19424.1 hypothetical protein CYV19_15025 [Natronobacterium gregoryi SP2]